MAVGDTITASRYNIIQARVASVLGLGAGDEGYGQAVASSQVSAGSTVTAVQMNNLLGDMTKCRVHKTNATPTSALAIAAGDTLEDDNSTSKKGYAQYESLSTTCQTARLSLGAGQTGVESGIASSRSSSWSTTITHEATISFTGYTVTNGDGSTTTISNVNHMRVFFNAGGTLNFSGTIGTGSTTINNDWRNLMTSVGTVAFGRTATSNGSVGTSLGFDDMTASYQTIFTKNASAYGANDYTLKAKIASNVLTFLVEFNDDKGPNPNFDEAITAVTTSTIQMSRPNNSSSVNITGPAFATTSNL